MEYFDPTGFRAWWRRLAGCEDTLDQAHLRRMAGRFSRRVRAWAKQHGVPVIYCAAGEPQPVLAGLGRPHLGKPPRTVHPIDQHYDTLQQEMRRTFETLALAA